MNPTVGKSAHSGARHPIHVVLNRNGGVQTLPKLRGHPLDHSLPFVGILKRQGVERHGARRHLPVLNRLQQLLATLGRGFAPPGQNRYERLRGPVEALCGRLAGRGNGGVESDVEESTLQFIHHQVWLIGKADIQVAQHDHVDMFDLGGLLLRSNQHWAQHRAERDQNSRFHWCRLSSGIHAKNW